MNNQQTALLTGSELHGLLDRWQLKILPSSPLNSILNMASEPPRTPTVLGEKWRSALAILAAPDHSVRAITSGPNATKIAFFYGATAKRSAEMVGCWLEGDLIRISFPWTSDTIVEAAGRVLIADLPFPPDSLSVTLSPTGLTALMAAVDVLRAARLTSLLERRVGFDLCFDAADLQRQTDLGLPGDDARWSVTLLRLAAPSAAPPTPNGLPIGLQELARAQLVKLDNTKWEPTEALMRLATYWMASLPAVAHESLTIQDGNTIREYKHCIGLRGDGPLWLIEYDGLANGQPRATLRSLDGTAYLAWLPTMINPPPGLEPVAVQHPGLPSGSPPQVRPRPTTMLEADDAAEARAQPEVGKLLDATSLQELPGELHGPPPRVRPRPTTVPEADDAVETHAQPERGRAARPTTMPEAD